jgi:hypothetical protein
MLGDQVRQPEWGVAIGGGGRSAKRIGWRKMVGEDCRRLLASNERREGISKLGNKQDGVDTYLGH